MARKGVAAALALSLVVLGVPASATAVRADDNPSANPGTNPTANPSASPPVRVDPNDADLELPEGAKLADPKVLDVISVTDSSSSEDSDANDGEERQEQSNSKVTYALQADILFRKDSYKLSAGAKSRIEAIASDISAKKVTSPIRVFGFTDNLGSSVHGDWLSKKRADAVYKVLSKELGSAGDASYSFQVRGYGEDYPIADNSTESGRKQNRRVEITFTPPAAR